VTDQEAASWRNWTNLLGRIRFGKQQVAGKTLSGLVIKAVAGRLSSYADRDGSRVRPGIARIAIDLETSHTTVRNAITVLERVGLLRLEVKASRRQAAVYQLVISAGLIEEAVLWSPDRYADEIRILSMKYQGRGPVEGSPTPTGSANDGVSPTPQESVIEEVDLPNADAVGSGKSANADAVGCLSPTRTGSAINHGPIHNSDQPPNEDVRTDLAVVCARDRAQNAIPVDLASRRCRHGRSTRQCDQCPADPTEAAKANARARIASARLKAHPVRVQAAAERSGSIQRLDAKLAELGLPTTPPWAPPPPSIEETS
jgi:hypothetical protein